MRPNSLEDAPQLQLHVDRVQAQSMGLQVSDIYNAISLMLAPVYANDFFYEGRIKRVNLRADAPFRTGAESLGSFYTPSPGNGMIPLNTVVDAEWITGPPSLSRYGAMRRSTSSAPLPRAMPPARRCRSWKAS